MFHIINSKQAAEIVGYVAAFFGAIAFLPQAIRIWKTKHTKDISFMSFALLTMTTLLWLIYGLLLGAMPIILVNIVILILSIYIIYMKQKYR